MNIYYLYNSGFSVEIGEDALIFDYYKGGLRKPWRAPLAKKPDAYRGVYVFASHIHGDHYNPAIFDWLAERGDIHYILSGDIRPAVPAKILSAATGANNGVMAAVINGAVPNVKNGAASAAKKDAATYAENGASFTLTFLNEGGRARAGSLDVTAYGSTDAGVSFHVLADSGASVFHAGDLNFWHWRDESTEAEIAEADAAFTDALAKIHKGVAMLDAAFFPVDPRQGSEYYRGAVRFCEAMRPALLIPMHFSSKFEPPQAFYAEISPYAKVIHAGPRAGRLII